YVLIVGHNQEGRFAFLNGSDKALDDLANDCAASGKICIFISCRSRKYIHAGVAYGLSSELTFPQAFYITKAVQDFLISRKSQSTSPAVLYSHLQQTEAEATFKFQTRYLILKGCGAATGLIVLAIVVADLSDDDCKRPGIPCK